MKVLLVTDQYIDIRTDGCYCNYALSGTLRNMSTIGELYVAAANPKQGKPAAQPINQKMECLAEANVRYLKNTTSSVLDYMRNNAYNKKVLNELIPQVDLVIGYTPGHNLLGAYKIAKKYNIPYMSFLVACPWDGMHNHHRLLVRMMAPVYYLMTRWLVRNSDYVHYVTKLFLQHRYPTRGKSLGCSDANLGEPVMSALSERLEKISEKSGTDIVKIVTIGHTDVKYKGQEFVIKAISRLLSGGDKRYHYYLIGAGEGGHLKQLCKQLGVGDNVIFLGRKTPDEVFQILSGADIYIQPSLQEGLPRAVVEAMSMALPCIGFDTGGIPELLDPDFIVRKKDVDGIVNVIRKLEDKELYKNTVQRNFQVAQEYEHSFLTSRIHEFFNEIKTELQK